MFARPIATDRHRLAPAPAAARVLFADEFDDYPAGVTVLDDPGDDAVSADAVDASLTAEPVDVDLIRAEATASGRSEALAELAAERDRAMAQMMKTVSASLAASAADAAAIAHDAADAIAGLVLGMMSAALPALCARHGPAEVAAIAARLLPALTAVPQVTIRVHPRTGGDLGAGVAGLDAEFLERIRIVDTESLAAGDVQIVWQDGQAGRDTKLLLGQIADILGSLGLMAHDTMEA